MEALMSTFVLRVHLEKTGDLQAPFVWWAESDELPGFSAAADTLPALIAQATAAVHETVAEEAQVNFLLVDSERDSSGDFDEELDPRRPVARSVSALANLVSA